MNSQLFHFALFFLLSFSATFAQLPDAPPSPQPDDRFKTDILLVIGHPDDGTLINGYLARAVLDEHKRVAVIACTSGDGAYNARYSEAGKALAQVLVQEARQAFATLGIINVWFLGHSDTPGQNVLWSLDNWHHGQTLDEVVRLVRLTRPEIILTTLPDYVAGENHDDHQAAGVIATEAFDLAGDPTAFPEQIYPPRGKMMNLTEGLHPWQPKKIYYFSDAYEDFSQYWHDPRDISPFRKNPMEGAGPAYANTDVSPSRHIPYARIAAEEQSFYLTQEGIGDRGKKALATGDFSDFQNPVRFVFGKSVVRSSVTGDIFESVAPGAAPFAPVRGYQPQIHTGLTLEFGDPWAFYSEFWAAHNIEHLANLLPTPEVAIPLGGTLYVPMFIRNATDNPEEVTLSVTLPSGWKEDAGSARYHVGPHEVYPAQAILSTPANGKREWQEIIWKAEANGRQIGTRTFRVLLGPEGLPQ